VSASDLTPRRVVVVGMGSEYRRDDGAGPAVADLVTREAGGVTNLGPIADPLDLLGLWDDADLAIVVDAVRTGAEPGTVRLIELGTGPPADPEDPTPPAGSSTHGIGLAGVLRLARAIGRAPRRVVVVGIEGGDFGQGEGLSPAVARALPHAARHVTELVTEPIGGAG
jgi:hydrogenase maturation protease